MSEINETQVLDDDAWARGERYWRAVVDEILATTGQTGEWPPWQAKFYGDGVTPIPREDLSICDGRSGALDRAFSIQQFPLSDATPTIFANVEDYAEGLLGFPDINDEQDVNRWFEEVQPHTRVPRSALIMRLEYSEETAAAARSLLTKWLTPETTVAEMETVIVHTSGVDHWYTL